MKEEEEEKEEEMNAEYIGRGGGELNKKWRRQLNKSRRKNMTGSKKTCQVVSALILQYRTMYLIWCSLLK